MYFRLQCCNYVDQLYNFVWELFWDPGNHSFVISYLRVSLTIFCIFVFGFEFFSCFDCCGLLPVSCRLCFELIVFFERNAFISIFILELSLGITFNVCLKFMFSTEICVQVAICCSFIRVWSRLLWFLLNRMFSKYVVPVFGVNLYCLFFSW